MKFLLEANYTLDGVRGLKSEGGSARVAAAMSLIEGLGGKVESFYFAFGGTDVYLIADLPDNVSVAAAALGNWPIRLTQFSLSAQRTEPRRARPCPGSWTLSICGEAESRVAVEFGNHRCSGRPSLGDKESPSDRLFRNLPACHGPPFSGQDRERRLQEGHIGTATRPGWPDFTKLSVSSPLR